MKTYKFPYIALGFGLVLMLVVMKGSEAGDDGSTLLPLLTLLVANEFAFFVTAIGGYLGVRHIQSVGIKPVYAIATAACILLAGRFMWLGVGLWPL